METRSRRATRLLATVVLVTALVGPGAPATAARTGVAPAAAPAAAAAPTVTGAAGMATPLAGYQIQSTTVTNDSGAAISQPGYAATGWFRAAPRSTVLAALLQNNQYPDPFYSTNLRNIPTSRFTVPWWYRAEFTVLAEPGVRTSLDFSGVISRADVFVNGTQVATSAQVAGAYTHHELDITTLVRPGANAVAFRIHPNDAGRDLTMGWIDWLQNPPDRNMGIFRDVLIRRNGPVSLRGAQVLVSLNNALDQATLTAKVEARNHTGTAATATISGQVAGRGITTTATLAAGETRTVTFGAVTLANPQVWWPAGMGGQHLYELNLAVNVGGNTTDTATERFGVRTVTGTLDASGHRAYRINGRPILVKGGGWSPDVFLRWDPTFVEDKIRYVLDLGLNTIRLEGHLEPDEFFEITDRLGVLVLPGWECCNKWESGSWSAADYTIARASMSAEAVRLRNHPSVISFLIGSDIAPSAMKERNYVEALRAADWPTPIVPVASDNGSPITGRSGMKMPGPYDWVPPSYWYHKREGGAFGFNSETSAGPDVPTLDTLRRMMSPAELTTLWQDPNATHYHRSPSGTFNNLRIFNNAMIGRYGAATGLEDYVRKAQLQQYENVRAQFEAYGRNFTDASNPSTGVIYWMLNSGWTSLHWQLFDRYLDQNGAYYGAKKANEPLHIQYSYDNNSVVVVNSRPGAANGLTARVAVYNMDGTERFTTTAGGLSVAGGGGRTTAATIPAIAGLSPTYLVKLTLSDSAGQEVSRNVYWLSTANDVIDWSRNTWYYVPTSSYANLRGLAGMAAASVAATATSVSNPNGTTTTTVTLRHSGAGRTPAFYVDAHVLGAGNAPVLPITWNDNAVSLWPGESTTLRATYRTADLRGATPSVRITGWNVATQTVPGGGEPDVVPPSAPANPRAAAVTANSARICWDASVDNVAVAGYDVRRGGQVVGTVAAPETCFDDTGLQPNRAYTYTVVARDVAGNTSPASPQLQVSTGAGPSRHEAENATVAQGVVESNHAGFSGTGFVNYNNVAGSYVEFTVNAAAAGTMSLAVRYANGTTVDRPMDVAVGGGPATRVSFPGTGAWTTWATRTVTVTVAAGTNRIRLTAATANGGPNLDCVDAG